MNRAQKCEKTRDEAERLAAEHGMRLTNPSDGCYQLRHLAAGWIVNAYPRRKGAFPRLYHDPHHRGPFLDVPEQWTLLDVVQAAVRQWRARRPYPSADAGD